MTELKLTSYFRNLNNSISDATSEKKATEESKIPYRESATLNQILYVNEKHNKRELPKNEDKKNLHEILENDTMQLSEFEKEVQMDLNNLDKTWKKISIVKKRELLEKYCRAQKIQLTDPVKRTILMNDKYVSYSQEDREIEDISIPL